MEIEKKEFMIDWEGKKCPVVIKKLSFAEKNSLWDDKNIVTQRFAGEKLIDIQIKTGKLKEMSIYKSIMKAPFKNELSIITHPAFPDEVGNQIWIEVDKFSKISEVKKKISSGQLKQENGPKVSKKK